jgi:hypothetical protein
MTLASIITGRRIALVNQWVREPLVQVQVESPDALPNLVFLDDNGERALVDRLPRRSRLKVAIVQRPGNEDTNASVWVRADYGGYRDAYLAFVKQVYRESYTSADLGGFDVDHLLNRARSPGGAGFIRVEAVQDAVNQAWGRLFEKQASNPAFYANQHRSRRTMSWVICAKLAGQMPPAGPGDTAGIDRLVDYFVSIGMTADEARDGLTSMLDFAYGLRRSA